jgi:hypothetical protein
MSGGDNPTRLASHQAPRRAGSTSLCPPQLRRSGEKEIQTCAPESVSGRCSRAKLHDQAETLEAVEVVGQRERHARSPATERGVGHDVPIQLVDEGDAGVFDAPQLLGIALRIRTEGGLRIDRPVIDAVARSGGTQMRMAGSLLDSAQEKGRAIPKPRRAGVEHSMCRVRPVGRRQNGIRGVAVEQGFVVVGGGHETDCRACAGTSGASSGAIVRNSCKASRNERVASAPWF